MHEPTPKAVENAARPRETRSLSAFGVTLEDGIKLAGVGVAVCYVIGLLVVQFYLVSIGVSDFTLVQPRYVLTGFFALLPLIAVVSIVASIFASVLGAACERRESGRNRLRDAIETWVWPVLGIVIVTSAILGLTVTEIDWSAPYAPVIIVLVMPFVALMGVLSSPVRFGFGDRSRFARTFAAVLQVTYVFWAIGLVAVLYLDFIANSIFPVVPEQLGGGQPQTVELVFSENGWRWLADTGLLSAEPQSRPLPMRLLWETEHMLVLREPDTSDDTVIHLDRDMVAVVLVDPSDPPRNVLRLPLPTQIPEVEASPTS